MIAVIKGVVAILTLLGLVAGVVVTLDSLGISPKKEPSWTEKVEARFRAVCTNVKGTTVWNGKQWECLK